MKKIILIIVILLLAGGSFAFFKFNNIKEAQGKILEQIGQGSLFNNLFKKAGSFIEENINVILDCFTHSFDFTYNLALQKSYRTSNKWWLCLRNTKKEICKRRNFKKNIPRDEKRTNKRY